VESTRPVCNALRKSHVDPLIVHGERTALADEHLLAVRQVSELSSHSKDSFCEEMADGSWPTPAFEILAQSWRATVVGRVAGMLPATFS